MTRIPLILGWLLVALDLVAAVGLVLGRDGGDAASRGLGSALGALLGTLALVAAALLL